jgi:hypothetical protein
MRLRLTILVLSIAISGCTSKHELARCKGPLIVMNQDHWQPSPLEIDALGKLCPEEK